MISITPTGITTKIVNAIPRLSNKVTSPSITIFIWNRRLRLLEDYHLTPKTVAFDTDLNIAIFEWIEGKSLEYIENEHIDQALNFVEKLNELNSPDLFQAASEACTSAEQLFSQIEHRLQQLETVEKKYLQK